MVFKRHPANPILIPILDSDWECYNVFNPGVIHHNGLFHMLYRAQGLDWISRIGYAVSQDGIHWNRLRDPVLVPSGKDEARGVEDPRITEIEGVFYMSYTAYGNTYYEATGSPYQGGGITPMFAQSQNFINWQRIGPLVQGEDNKDHLLLSRRLEGKYVALHRRRPSVWLAYSKDMRTWLDEDMRPVFGPRLENVWESNKVGANGPPIDTDEGWLLLYHATDLDNTYRFGVCLLDKNNPGLVLRRPNKPIFEPSELWELKGEVPRVVFSCANPVVDGNVYIYYGGADHVIGLAICSLKELLDFVLQCP